MRALARQLHPRSISGYPLQPRVRCLHRLYAVDVHRMASTILFDGQQEKLKAQLVASADNPTTVHPVLKSGLGGFLDGLDSSTAAAWAKTNKFNAKSGELLLVPGPDGAISCVLLGINSWDDIWAYAALPGKLPPGNYKLALDIVEVAAVEESKSHTKASAANKALLGWMLGM